MMEKIQRFGGAMFTPVMLFAVSGILIGFGTLFTTELVMGSIAAPGTTWFNFWNTVLSGGWTVFNQLPLLFAMSLPIGLANKQNARACMESLVIYLIFNNYLSAILNHYGPSFGVDFSQEVTGGSGLAMIANIKTLDMGMVGALLISGIAIWLHNRYFDKKLPEWLGVFKGSAFVVGIGFIVMLPVALLSAFIWPKIQLLIGYLQTFILNSGLFGVWIFNFLERILIPTGLHHLLYAPFFWDNIVVQGGTSAAWARSLPMIAADSTPIIEQAPFMIFNGTGHAKMFGSLGIALAIYATADKENKKKVASLLIPSALTAFMCGVTEPLEFTFLFIAPALFVVHSLLVGTLATIMIAFGVVGNMSGGFLDLLPMNIIPLTANHGFTYVKLFIIGLIAVGVWFLVFRFMIVKFDYNTPGRTTKLTQNNNSNEEIKLYTKKDYKEKTGINSQNSKASINSATIADEEYEGIDHTSDNTRQIVYDSNKAYDNEFQEMADRILIGLGGASNIKTFTNCMTRLRVVVNDVSKLKDDEYFTDVGAYGTSRNGNSIHVIVGMNVQYVADEFATILERN